MQATKLPNQASSHVNARTMMKLMHSAALNYADQSHVCIVGHNAIIEWQDRGETSSAIYKVSTFSTFSTHPRWSFPSACTTSRTLIIHPRSCMSGSHSTKGLDLPLTYCRITEKP